ncbi:MAG: DUF1501 domain-containing protein [Phycisphaeraceae bacterium]|nr:DUF1501 domain-containing protein [Phycisphaeraceae bacterium]
MDLHHSKAFTRRAFLERGVMLASATVVAPGFVQGTALGLPSPSAFLASLAGVPEDRVLVVVQLSGGNDGLNTVVPYGADEYYRARRGIGIARGNVLELDGRQGLGLHPALAPMKELYDAGLCSVFQGVGYPNPNRSHFKSMDIWHTADTSGTGEGWIGRYLDSECVGFGAGESGSAQGAPPAINIGRTAPLAMQGRKVNPVSFENASVFRWLGEDHDRELKGEYDRLNRRESASVGDTNEAFLTKTALDAQVSSDLIRRAVAAEPLVRYPGNELARQLSLIAQMIRAGLKTRVYYASLGGFDTHAGQGGANGRHAQLLGQFASSMKAFYDDLKAQGNDGRVMTLSFSEFGRRVSQNASNGTDHGTAAPMFLFGPMVRPGVHGTHPPMSDLDGGDLKHTLDFRHVYAGVLDSWMRADASSILQGRYRPALVLRKS